MTEEKRPREVVRRKTPPGFMTGLSLQVRLVLRLIADSRVNPLFKLLPIGSMIYLLFPDLAPGPIDDAVIIGLGTYMFFELCPPDVVEEHRAALWGEENPAPSGTVVDGEFSDPRDEG